MNDERRYQVFVSSTFLDLEQERQKVLQAILEMKAFPAGMELFPSADEEQFAFIKREIDSSDYYVLILAGKYGSVGPSGVSYTEMEYDYAVSRGKAVLRFLHSDISTLPANSIELLEERRAKLQAFRDKVGTSRLCKKYINPDDLKAKVWQSLQSEIALRPGTGWVRADTARRVEDLERIASLQTEVMALREMVRAAEDRRSSSQLPDGLEPIQVVVEASETLLSLGSGVPASISITTNWNRLLAVAFRDSAPSAPPEVARESLARALVIAARLDIPDVALNEGDGYRYFSNLESIISTCRIMFLGMGLMQIEGRDRIQSNLTPFLGPIEFWILTEKGLAVCAADSTGKIVR